MIIICYSKEKKPYCHVGISDLDLILQKSPFLIQEMVRCVSQLVGMAKEGRGMLKLMDGLIKSIYDFSILP